MNIVDFELCHVELATQIAKQSYEKERRYVPALPSVDSIPDLAEYAKNRLGVSAFEGDVMVGFLCVIGPFENAFRSTNAIGVFSPMGANGAVGEKRADIYARMYQVAAKKWVESGATSHSICLYAHDKLVQEKFFQYGFGIRCMDAIQMMNETDTLTCHEHITRELSKEEYQLIFPLNKLLVQHLNSSPSFMCYPFIHDAKLLEMIMQSDARYFVTIHDEQIVSYIKISNEGENFACSASDMMNISGAYCLPEYRGMGVFKNLLDFVIKKLRSEGYIRLGVDFESINPNAYHFWLKYFEAYTNGVVRRVDEFAL